MVTIREVSRRANVSKATVSRVINGTVPVSEATRQRVLAAIEELGFKPDAFARALATRRSGGVGVTINDLSSPFYGAMLKGIETVIEASGMHLLVSSGHAEREAEARAVAFLRERRSDALIVQVDATPKETLLEWAQGDVPLVIFGHYLPELSDRCIYLDNERGGYLATLHLLEQGHTRIAHIGGPLSIEDAQARLKGYRRALTEAGIPFDPQLVLEADFQLEGGQRATEALLVRDLQPTALFVANDQMAAGALTALEEAGLRVPQDMSLVGYDDILFARYLSPKLTTIRQPLFEMGQAAATLALRQLQGEGGEVRQKFNPELVVRQSVKKV